MAKIKNYSIAVINRNTGKRDFIVLNAMNKTNARKKISKTKFKIGWISENKL